MYIINAIVFDFSRVDSTAITIFIIGFGVVYAALTIIYSIFAVFSKLLKINFKKKNKIDKKQEIEDISKLVEPDSEIYAAIAMALSMHFEDVHDDESMILTINLNERMNSQWNSKLQNIGKYIN